MISSLFLILVHAANPVDLNTLDGLHLHLQTGGYSYSVDRSISFSGKGRPAYVVARSRGVKISGGSISGKATLEAGGTYAFRSAAAIGDAIIVSDTQEARAFLLSHPAANHTTPPANGRTDDSHTEVKSDEIDYVGDAIAGELKFPGSFHVTEVGSGSRNVLRNGHDALQTYSDSLDFKGGNGALQLDTRPEPKSASSHERIRRLTSATVNGPVEFHFERIERTAGDPKPKVVHVSGHCDRMVLTSQPSGERVVATGNVLIDYEELGTSSGDQAVIDLDDDYAVTGIAVSNAVDHIKVSGGGGSGGT